MREVRQARSVGDAGQFKVGAWCEMIQALALYKMLTGFLEWTSLQSTVSGEYLAWSLIF